jgi:hypothetical protein
MSLLNCAGRFKAFPVEWSVDERDSGLPFFRMLFHVTAGRGEGEAPWEDWAQQNYQITGFFNLFKRDGTPNSIIIEKLMQSLGWDGKSLDALHAGQWNETEVQIETQYEHYNNKSQLRVNWIHPINFEPGFKKCDPLTVKNLATRWDAVLCAGARKPTAPMSSKPSPKSGPTLPAPTEPMPESAGDEIPEEQVPY